MGERALYRLRETIVTRLRQAGCSVIVTTKFEDGFPDLTIGTESLTLLAYVTEENAELTGAQREFQKDWKGMPVLILHSADLAWFAVDDAVQAWYWSRAKR